MEFVCECGKAFSSQRGLKIHKTRMHNHIEGTPHRPNDTNRPPLTNSTDIVRQFEDDSNSQAAPKSEKTSCMKQKTKSVCDSPQSGEKSNEHLDPVCDTYGKKFKNATGRKEHQTMSHKDSVIQTSKQTNKHSMDLKSNANETGSLSSSDARVSGDGRKSSRTKRNELEYAYEDNGSVKQVQNDSNSQAAQKSEKISCSKKKPTSVRESPQSDHQSNERLDFVCDTCGKICKNASGLKRHQTMSHKVQNTPTPMSEQANRNSVDLKNSPDAGKTKPNDLEYASKDKESKVPHNEYICDVCHQLCKSERGLKTHKTKAHKQLQNTQENTQPHQLVPVNKSEEDEDGPELSSPTPVGINSAKADRTKSEFLTQNKSKEFHPYNDRHYEINDYDQPNEGNKETVVYTRTIETVRITKHENDAPLPQSIPPHSSTAKKFWQKLEVENKLDKHAVSAAAESINNFIDDLQKLIKRESKLPMKDVFKSGSYYDKTKVTAPDEFDFMFAPDMNLKPVFDGCPSGYCKIVAANKQEQSKFPDLFNHDGFLHPQKFKDTMFEIFNRCVFSSDFRPARRTKRKARPPESPAFTVLLDAVPGKQPLDIDLVPTVEFKAWPTVARKINVTWMDEKYKERVMEKFHAVTKTFPGDKFPASTKELFWRISFSHAEKILIFHANADNACRKDVFRLFKQLMEMIKSRAPRKIEKFCSYHLKMFMLEFYDEAESTFRQSELYDLCGSALRSLQQCVEKGHIKNYFIQNDNILQYVPYEELKYVATELKRTERELMQLSTL